MHPNLFGWSVGTDVYFLYICTYIRLYFQYFNILNYHIMNIVIIRSAPLVDGSVHGKLYLDDRYFCDTLENEKYIIPCGTYKVRFNYPSARFHGFMPLIEDVPNRSGILIHWGNKKEDSKGCILVGRYSRPGTILFSRLTFKKFLDRIYSSKLPNDCFNYVRQIVIKN